MKQTLSLRLGQQLAMTPQLHQAIKLMQLSALELNLEVQQAIECNPMLELVEDGEDAADMDDGEEPEPAEEREHEAGEDADALSSDDFDATVDVDSADDELEIGEPLNDIPEDLPVDVSWDDVYQPSAASSAGGTDDDGGFEERNSAADTLLDHLRWQLNLTPMSDRDRLIALVVIDSIDDNGMLVASAGELLETLDPSLGVEPDELEAVLKLVQRFDPPGVGARDLAECLLLQLEQLPEETPWRLEAMNLVRHHFPLLARRDFATAARRTKLDDGQLVEVMTLVRSLHPRPGTAIGDGGPEYIEPDVVVRRNNGRWAVALNRENAPRVRLNSGYAGLVKRADSSPDNQYLKDNLQDAKWFLKNLEYRNETLLKVAVAIVERQRGFLEHGEEAMQPLVLADIAAAADRHESTISRVTTRKYMETPRGVYELKYFFSSHVGTANGGEVSSTAIRALIKKLTGEEDPRKPLSDNKIASLLQQRNINVARRTVAKYRESLAIPPSNERKRLV